MLPDDIAYGILVSCLAVLFILMIVSFATIGVLVAVKALCSIAVRKKLIPPFTIFCEE